MPETDTGWTERPNHVPAELVVDFDYFNPPHLQEIGLQLAYKRLRERAPRIFWTGRNGGHWVVTRASEIEAVQTEHLQDHILAHRVGHVRVDEPDDWQMTRQLRIAKEVVDPGAERQDQLEVGQ